MKDSVWTRLPLSARGPREVRTTAASRILSRAAPASVALSLALGAFLGFRATDRMERLHRFGESVQAEVVGKREIRGRGIRRRLHLRYSVGGSIHEDETDVDDETYRFARFDRPVGLTVLRSDPGTYEIGPVSENRVQSTRLAAIGSTLLATFVFEGLALLLRRESGRQIRALRDFDACPARVVSLDRSYGTSKGHVVLVVEFREPPGIVRRIRARLRAALAESLPPGAETVILMDPHDSSQFQIYDALYLAELTPSATAAC